VWNGNGCQLEEGVVAIKAQLEQIRAAKERQAQFTIEQLKRNVEQQTAQSCLDASKAALTQALRANDYKGAADSIVAIILVLDLVSALARLQSRASRVLPEGCWIKLGPVAERRSSAADAVLDLFLGVMDGAAFGRKQVGDTNHTAQFAYRPLRRVAVQIPIDFAQKSHMPLISCDPNGIVADLPSKDTAGSL
jgi:hypothetical protein